MELADDSGYAAESAGIRAQVSVQVLYAKSTSVYWFSTRHMAQMTGRGWKKMKSASIYIGVM